jgi:drug/metabolite transporter (DMT)-like permease
MIWQIFLAISILTESFGRAFQRFLLKGDKNNPIIYLIWVQLIASLYVFSFTIFFTGFKIPANLPSLLPHLSLIPLFYSAGPLLIYKSLQQTEASIFTILFNSRAVIVVIGSIILLKNHFSLIQILGTILILTSIIIVSLKKERIQFKKGELFSLLAGFLIALGTINDSIILKSFDPLSYVAFGFLLPGLFIWAINYKLTPKILSFTKTELFPKLALLSLFFATTYSTYCLAFSSSQDGAKIGAIFPVSSILTVLISIILLKERDRLPIKIAAALISFLGVYLVS